MIDRLGVRQLTEAREEYLSPNAAKSRYARRKKSEEPCPVRTAFQRDRDRILYSKAFRRLKHKTQVFIAPRGDHYITRLTHTLEVAQIARTIARALDLNEDLTEAIALGHDLGHTPFGHVGEEVLNKLYPGGFRHNEQSLRVVDIIENDGKGLNLTWEVRDGILNHSKSRESIAQPCRVKAGTLEGEICRLADAVAYINHDIDDALRAGLISDNDLPAAAASLGGNQSARLNAMICDIIERSWGVRENAECREVAMSPAMLERTGILRDFLFEHVYELQSGGEEVNRARRTLVRLYEHFRKHPDRLPAEYARLNTEPERGVVDYIAGMTDQFATGLEHTLT